MLEKAVNKTLRFVFVAGIGFIAGFITMAWAMVKAGVTDAWMAEKDRKKAKKATSTV